MLRFYCWITGDNYSEVVKDTRASKKKIMSLGISIFGPVISWIITAFLLFRNIFESTLLTSIISAIIAGLMVFIIEKVIILTPTNRAISWFRITLGLFIALFGSIIIDEILFKDDIDRQLMENKEYYINDQLRVVDGKFTTEISALNKLYTTRYQELSIAQDDYKKEIDGSGGSKEYGNGPAAKANMGILKTKEREYQIIADKLILLKHELKSEKARVQTLAESSYSNTALLHRIKAMFNLIFNEPVMLFVYLLVTGIVFLLEFMVVIIKAKSPITSLEAKIMLTERISERQIAMILKNENILFLPEKGLPQYRNAKKLMEKNRNKTLLF